jgi:hypothetical protein
MTSTSVRPWSVSAFVLAGTIGLVGLVWAGTAAQEDTTPDTTVPVDSVPVDTVPEGDDLSAVLARLESLESRVTELTAQLDAALIRIDEAVATVAGYGAKVSQLSDTGVYSGPLRPGQITPKLKPQDLLGDWPLDRTSGKLTTDQLSIAVNGCSSSSRYYSVLTLTNFRQFTCIRIPK